MTIQVPDEAAIAHEDRQATLRPPLGYRIILPIVTLPMLCSALANYLWLGRQPSKHRRL